MKLIKVCPTCRGHTTLYCTPQLGKIHRLYQTLENYDKMQYI